jgi:hypothetical protein
VLLPPLGKGELAPAHRTLPPSASGEDVHAGAELSEEAELGVAAGRLAVVLARALAGQFAQAPTALTSSDGRWGTADPLPRRFDAAALQTLVEQAGLVVEDVHGVRLFSDLVPSALIDSDADRAALLDLEAAASRHPRFGLLGELGAAVHVLART